MLQGNMLNVPSELGRDPVLEHFGALYCPLQI